MADNTQIDNGTTGDNIATDDVGGVKHQRVKVQYGDDGSATDVSATNPLPVTAASLPLPGGASTSAKQDTGNTSLASIDGKITAVNTGAVVVSSSALPGGAATSAAQTAAQTSLSSIDGKTPALGQALAAASVPVILPAATVTTLTPPAAITNFAVESGGNLAAAKTDLDTVVARIPVQGQALAAASVPVVLPAAQITTLTPPAAITGFATAAKQPALGTAGSASTDVLTVQGAASMTALKVDPSGVTSPVSLASVPSHAVTNAGTFAVQQTATSAGGYTPGKLVSAASTNATSVKASAGTLGYLTVGSINAAARYIKLFNKASAPTVGTDTPVAVFLIPGNTAGAGTNIPLPPQGINFSTGIAFAITTGITDADTGAVAASEIVVSYGYN